MDSLKTKVHKELVSVRDTVESVWVAIVLAFVLRAFMIEAFVIPTGSMAPRLMGEHWDLQCPSCGYEYSFGFIGGLTNDTRVLRGRAFPPHGEPRCPNCGYPYPGSEHPGFLNGGDRVLVLKYLYNFREPQPFDVVVFKNPQNNRENYIKRMIGLPGETIEIVHGDVFYRNSAGEPWQIRRKPPRAQEAMWQVIFNNDYQPDPERVLRYPVAPPKWTSQSKQWNLQAEDGRKFTFKGDSPAEAVFQADRNVFLPHYGYNIPQLENAAINQTIDICSDMKLSMVFTPKSDDAGMAIQLSSFERSFRATVSADGTAVLSGQSKAGGPWVEWSRTKLPALPPGQGVEIALTHADFRVTLWVDSKPVLQSTDEQYPADYAALKDRLTQATVAPIPTPQARIVGLRGEYELLHVQLMRDVYYTNPGLARLIEGPLGEYARRLNISMDQAGWGTMNNPITLRRFANDPDLDEFFVLGDNSPQSLDGRAWTQAAPTLRLYDENGKPLYQLGTVPRYNLIGRALCVYWPSGFRPPGLPGLPIIPNVGKMRLIR
jgi:signal peptidase I